MPAELLLLVPLIGSPAERLLCCELQFAWQPWESTFVREQQTQLLGISEARALMFSPRSDGCQLTIPCQMLAFHKQKMKFINSVRMVFPIAVWVFTAWVPVLLEVPLAWGRCCHPHSYCSFQITQYPVSASQKVESFIPI